MPGTEIVRRVQGLIPQVMDARTRLESDEAGLIAVVYLSPVEVASADESGGTRLSRRFSFPEWTFSSRVRAKEGGQPIVEVSEEVDRVRFYLSLAADRAVPIAGYAYSKTMHAPIYRGFEKASFPIVDVSSLEGMADDEIHDMVAAWYRLADQWMAAVPRGSVLDRAIMTRMRAMDSSRRDAILACWSALDVLAEASAAGAAPLDFAPSTRARVPRRLVAKAFDDLLSAASPGTVVRARNWRKLRNRLTHPYGSPTAEQDVWAVSRELWEASGRVLRSVLSELESVPAGV